MKTIILCVIIILWVIIWFYRSMIKNYAHRTLKKGEHIHVLYGDLIGERHPKYDFNKKWIIIYTIKNQNKIYSDTLYLNKISGYPTAIEPSDYIVEIEKGSLGDSRKLKKIGKQKNYKFGKKEK